MFEGSKSVTVALSGGADSVALLKALLELKDEYGLLITAAHLNHSLRGDESDGDEEFVKDLCEHLGVSLFCEKADINREAEMSGESIELAARRVRYEFLERVSVGLIATAHTADDNIETVLFNMARGTGLRGLCGIPPIRGKIVRPLIFVTRRQVEDYCAANNLQYRTDSSNLSDVYARNKIRHNAVPTLLEINSAAVKNVSALSEHLRQDESLLQSMSNQAFSYCCKNGGLDAALLLSQHPALQCRLVQKLAESQIGLKIEHIHIDAVLRMLKSTTTRQSVKNDCFAVVQNGILKFMAPRSPVENFDREVFQFPFCANGYVLNAVSMENFEKVRNVNNLSIENVIDCDKICGRLRLRNRLPGDKIRLAGRGCTKTFKNLFNERGLEQEVRDGLPVLSDDEGVLWLAGFGVDERVAVDMSTKNVIVIQKESK